MNIKKIKADITIVLPVFNITTGWFFGDFTTFVKACSELDGSSCDLGGIKYDGYCHGSLTWVEDKWDTNTVIHELTHLVDHVLEAVGVDDCETRAYCMGYLGEKVFTAIAKKYKKGKEAHHPNVYL